MNTSPIISWDGAEAYFTFADNPAILTGITLIGIAVCVWTIVSMVKHENDSYRKF